MEMIAKISYDGEIKQDLLFIKVTSIWRLLILFISHALDTNGLMKKITSCFFLPIMNLTETRSYSSTSE